MKEPGKLIVLVLSQRGNLNCVRALNDTLQDSEVRQTDKSSVREVYHQRMSSEEIRTYYMYMSFGHLKTPSEF